MLAFVLYPDTSFTLSADNLSRKFVILLIPPKLVTIFIVSLYTLNSNCTYCIRDNTTQYHIRQCLMTYSNQRIFNFECLLSVGYYIYPVERRRISECKNTQQAKLSDCALNSFNAPFFLDVG